MFFAIVIIILIALSLALMPEIVRSTLALVVEIWLLILLVVGLKKMIKNFGLIGTIKIIFNVFLIFVLITSPGLIISFIFSLFK